MDMVQVFHMNKGEGEASYAKNCSVQKKILWSTKAFIEEAIEDYFGSGSGSEFPETMTVADLGCSCGPNALRAVTEIMDAVHETCKGQRRRSPKFMVFLNDLPSNDFNEVFASLPNFYKGLRDQKGPDFGPCFVAGLPGSFHSKLLPHTTLHFVHSSSSLHWLSQVPAGLNVKDSRRMVNKGKIYISTTSPSLVINAYVEQFKKDFLLFLKCRSEEVVSGGRMVLCFMGRMSNDPTSQQACHPWELIAHSLMSLVSQGLIEEEKVDGFNVPYYAPSVEEVKELIKEEGCFVGSHLEAFEIEWDGGDDDGEEEEESAKAKSRGERVSKMHRAVVESMLVGHFGKDVMDELFLSYTTILDHHLHTHPHSKLVNLLISLIRI